MGEVPKIRFKGFNDDWEQRKLSEISDVRDGTHDSPSYLSEGHPFVTSKNVKDGYINYDDIQYISDEDFEAINKRSKVDVNDILMGMIGTIGNLALIRTEPDFAIKNVALIKDTKQVSYLYLYHYLQSPNTEKQLLSGLDGGTQKFVSLKNIRELNIMVPSEAEQLRVGTFIESLDNLITLHQRKCDETKELKKYMLQKMFPKNGENRPEIRFESFDDAWEQRKLGDLSVSFEYGLNAAAKEFDGTNKYIRITDIDDESREFNTGNLTSPDLDLSNADNYKLTKGDILFARTGASVGKTYIYRESDGLVYYAGFLIRAKIKEDYDPEFVFQSTLTNQYEKFINVTSMRSGQPGVNAQEYSQYEIMVPKKAEQKKIAAYLRNIDNLITLHQNKCDELKDIKKYMLQNMFPQ